MSLDSQAQKEKKMNASKIRSEIEKVIAENRSHMHPKQRNKQYAPGKAQLAKLTELGILDYMPEGFGFSDADAVIRAATTEKSAFMNAYGEGEEIPASALNQAIEEEVKSEVHVSDYDYEYTDEDIAELDALTALDEMLAQRRDREFEAVMKAQDEQDARNAFRVDAEGFYL